MCWWDVKPCSINSAQDTLPAGAMAAWTGQDTTAFVVKTSDYDVCNACSKLCVMNCICFLKISTLGIYDGCQEECCGNGTTC